VRTRTALRTCVFVPLSVTLVEPVPEPWHAVVWTFPTGRVA